MVIPFTILLITAKIKIIYIKLLFVFCFKSYTTPFQTWSSNWMKSCFQSSHHCWKEFVPLDFSQSEPVLTGHWKRITQFRRKMNYCESHHCFYIFTKSFALRFNMGIGAGYTTYGLLNTPYTFFLFQFRSRLYFLWKRSSCGSEEKHFDIYTWSHENTGNKRNAILQVTSEEKGRCNQIRKRLSQPIFNTIRRIDSI